MYFVVAPPAPLRFHFHAVRFLALGFAHRCSLSSAELWLLWLPHSAFVQTISLQPLQCTCVAHPMCTVREHLGHIQVYQCRFGAHAPPAQPPALGSSTAGQQQRHSH